MKKTIAVLQGDGIGPEVTREAVKVLNAVAKKFRHTFLYAFGDIGGSAIEKHNYALPKETVSLCKTAGAILFGAIGDPKYDTDPKVTLRPEQSLLALRKALGLYINVRPIQCFPQTAHKSPLKAEIIDGVDFVIIRELTGGIYFGKPRGRSRDGKRAYETNVYTVSEIERISLFAFELAQKRKKKVTLVDKANVLETSRLWRETVTKIAQKFPKVILDAMYVDNASMQIIKRPKDFDVILTDNIFGDILSDEASVITGSIGMMPSASIGKRNALYEPIHGSFPKAAGKNTANPIGSILSAALLLNYSFGLQKEHDAIYAAVTRVLEKGIGTKDIVERNPVSTVKIGDTIAKNIL